MSNLAASFAIALLAVIRSPSDEGRFSEMTRFPRRTSAATDPRRLWSLVLLLATGLSAACGNDSVSDESSHELRDLARIEDLRELFNRDAGVPRLILLLSPT